MKIHFSLINRLTIFLSLLFSHVLTVNAAELPKLLKANPAFPKPAIQLQFDRQLQAETAEDLANYQIAPDVQVEYALLDDRLNRVLLLTSPLEVEKTYRLTLPNIQTGDSYNPPTRKRDNLRHRRRCHFLRGFTGYHTTCQ